MLICVILRVLSLGHHERHSRLERDPGK
jgi:hypothetical protein